MSVEHLCVNSIRFFRVLSEENILSYIYLQTMNSSYKTDDYFLSVGYDDGSVGYRTKNIYCSSQAIKQCSCIFSQHTYTHYL